MSVLKGRKAIIPCQADGFPPPTIVWKKAHGDRPGNYHDVQSTQRANLYDNGTLVLPLVTEDAQGFYLCEATNGIGAGLSKVIQLTVNAPPQFANPRANVSAGVDDNAILTCPVAGDPPLSVTWHKDGIPLQPTTSYRFEERESSVANSHNSGAAGKGVTYELVIKGVTRGDGGEYVCTVNNNHGHDSRTVTLYVQEPPSAPRSLHVSEKTSRSLHLAWLPSSDGNSPLTHYVLHTQRMHGVWQALEPEVRVDGSRSDVIVDGLIPATQYLFTLYAHNAIGASPPSEALQVTTEGEAPGGPPEDIKVTAASSKSLRITWSPPSVDVQHGSIVAYYIGYRLADIPNEQYKFVTVEVEGSPAGGVSPTECCSALVTELLPFTQYQVVLQAVNTHGAGPTSKEISTTTLQDVPSEAPAGLRCSPMTAQSLLVSWDPLPSALARGVLLGYRVLYTPVEHNTEKNRETTSTVSVSLRGLRPFTNYSIEVLGYTSMGEGPPSEPIRCATEEDVPGPPDGVKAAMAGPKSVVVSWRPPKNPNGQIVSYTITTRSRDGYVKKYVVRAPSTKHEISLDSRQGPLHIRVTAKTKIGEGSPTSPATVILQNLVPARITSWGEAVAVHWKEDVSLRCDAVGIPMSKRDWYRFEGPLRTQEDQRAATYHDGALVLRDVQRQDSANYTCRVSNQHGVDQITYTVLVQVPPSPPLVHATRTDATSITVAWRLSDDGGAPLLGLTLSYKRDYGEWQEETVPPTHTSHVLRGLTCGTHYQLYVTAYNKVGIGRPSEMVSAHTSGSVPRAGETEGAITANTTWAALSLSHWEDGGCVITHYSVAYRRTDEQRWVVVSERVEGTRPLELGGLDPGTVYVARVIAHNSAGTTTNIYPFTTAHQHGAGPAPGLITAGMSPLLTDIRVLLPVAASTLTLVAAAVAVCICVRRKPPQNSGQTETSNPTQIHTKDELKQREKYYATVRKNNSPHRDPAALERIPEYAEDIYPYATFQINNDQPSSRARLQQPPPPRRGSQGHFQAYSYQDTLPVKEGSHNEATYCRVGNRGRNPTPGPRSLKSESEEYDTFGSDSDTDPPASSRTESSNHLDHDRPYLPRYRV